MPKLSPGFYQQEDVVALARQLLGKQLYTCVNGVLTGGIIVETEAYNGITDKASHAYGNRYTSRTAPMYQAGGIAYVYLCYGIHYLFNVVTGRENNPQAVLIRGIEPLEGKEIMLERRNMTRVLPRITAGPGALAKALGIDKQLNAKILTGNEIWIEDSTISHHDSQIVASPRIGVAYAQEHAFLPWRFYVKGNPYVSKLNR